MSGADVSNPVNSRPPQYWLWLTLIAVVALGVRLAVTQYAVGLASPPLTEDGLDQLDYELLGYRLSTGAGYTLEDGSPTARRPPGTSLVILPVYWVFGRSYLAVRVWFALISAAVCVVSAQLVRRTFGDVTALLTAAALALDPGQFYYAIHLWSEAPYSLAISVATLLTLVAVQSTSRRFQLGTSIAAGLVWGFAVLLRPQTLLLSPVAAVGMVIFGRRLKGDYWRQFAVQCVCLSLVVFPWVARNAIVMGKPSLGTVVGGFTFYGAHNDTTFLNPEYRGRWVVVPEMADRALLEMRDEVAKEKIAWDRGLVALREHAWLLPQLILAKLYCLVAPFEPTANRHVYWAFAVSWIVMAPLVIVGTHTFWRRDPCLTVLIAGQIIAVLANTIIFYGAARFRHVLDPLLVPIAVVGLQTCAAWIGRWWGFPNSVARSIQATQSATRTT